MAVILLTDRRELGAPMHVVGGGGRREAEMKNAKKFTRSEAESYVATNGPGSSFPRFPYDLMTIDGD